MSSTHKPRTKGKRIKPPTASGSQGSSYIDDSTNVARPAFPLAAFLWPARGTTSQWVTLPLILMVAGLFRWAAGLWNYSGQATPPMYGDFEAQRHWMEITTHLPITRWYFYDLEYWGLDYPPLTAYHSWLIGKLGSLIDPTWFELDKSHGFESPNLKIYMRATVLVSEYLVYIPSLVVLLRHMARSQGIQIWESSIALVAILLQPSTLLIDHAHFQYNTVMLGFFLASVSSFMAGRRLWCSIFFVAALGFKQMALYYAPAFFVALLAVCFRPRPNILLLVGVALATVASFAVLLGPLLAGAYFQGAALGDKGKVLPAALPFIDSIPFLHEWTRDTSTWYYPFFQQLAQCIHRVFPFARGLFEDKVANLWCALNVVIKLREYPTAFLQRISLLATLASITPPCAILFLRPRPDTFLYALSATAWGFFLCSFQVHEKSVLLPLLPMTLALALRNGATPQVRAWVGWANALGAWTMFPLLQREDLRIPYFVLTLLWSYLLGLPPCSISAYWSPHPNSDKSVNIGTTVLHLSFYILMVGWHFCEAFVPAPEGKPDLWVVANVGIGAAGFGICYLWCLLQSLQTSGLLALAATEDPPTPKGKSVVR
ncbi:MAG: hypothetical protein M4579_001471 [Chaenotheca gracillima]|nr:MAG: hypothetical protein M4579_001471 [Chaenotheca gracillima]